MEKQTDVKESRVLNSEVRVDFFTNNQAIQEAYLKACKKYEKEIMASFSKKHG